LLNERVAAIFWSLLLIACLFVSIRMAWKMTGLPRSDLVWLGYCFPPALFCVILGQTSVLLLFGLCLFLRFHRTSPFAAGAALWFCTLKPHLFLPFALALLIWIVFTRAWKVLAGVLAAFAAGAAVTTAIDPLAWAQYACYVRTSTMTREFTPYFGELLRDRIDPAAEWLAFVPAILGCAWALAYFWKRRRAWNWLEQGSLLMLVSLLVAPFGWIFDQSLAMPAILFASSRARSRAVFPVLALIYLAFEIQLIYSKMYSPAYLWTAPAWLAWYLWARAARGQEAVPADIEAGANAGL